MRQKHEELAAFEMSSELELYVYNLLSFEKLPIWHSSIVVYGTEYSYGQDGITIKLSPGDPDNKHPIGKTSATEEAVFDLIKNLGKRYKAESYNICFQNCNTFTDEICQFLCQANIPKYISQQILVAIPMALVVSSTRSSLQPFGKFQSNSGSNQSQNKVKRKDNFMCVLILMKLFYFRKSNDETI